MRRAAAVAGATRETAASAAIVEDAAQRFAAAHADRVAPEVVLVIPAYKEVGSVGAVVRAVPSTMAGLRVDTLVVDDGSRDGTAEEAAAAGALVCQLFTNVGQGMAFRLGYRLARQMGASYIATADADGQFDPRELPGMLEVLLADDADLVNGSRRLGRSYSTGVMRNIGVVVFGALISLLLGVRVTDPANGLRVMRAEVTERVGLRQPQYQTSELLIRTHAAGFRIREVPVTMYPRTAGESKKGDTLRYGARFTRVVLTTWWDVRVRARQVSSGVLPSR